MFSTASRPNREHVIDSLSPPLTSLSLSPHSQIWQYLNALPECRGDFIVIQSCLFLLFVPVAAGQHKNVFDSDLSRGRNEHCGFELKMKLKQVLARLLLIEIGENGFCKSECRPINQKYWEIYWQSPDSGQDGWCYHLRRARNILIIQRRLNFVSSFYLRAIALCIHFNEWKRAKRVKFNEATQCRRLHFF